MAGGLAGVIEIKHEKGGRMGPPFSSSGNVAYLMTCTILRLLGSTSTGVLFTTVYL